MKKIISLSMTIFVFLGCFAFMPACDLFNVDPIVTYDDLDPTFYDAENWEYMLNGATPDTGGVPYSLEDGGIKFHNANQTFDLKENLANDSVSFLLQTSKDWQIWLRAENQTNTANAYKLFFKDEKLSIQTKDGGNIAYAFANDCGYLTRYWNKMEIFFSTTESLCTLSMKINDKAVAFTLYDGVEEAIVQNGNVIYDESTMTTALGNYFSVKVWYGDCMLQMKPLAQRSAKEPLRIACIGDSITYGSNADNVYTDSYPAQLQKLYGKSANVVNFGNSGKTIRDKADDPYRKTTEYNGALLFQPDITILMLGTNDSKTYQVPTTAELVTAYSNLIDDLLDVNPSMKIYIATCPYAYSSSYQINNRNIERIVIPAQLEVAEEYDLPIIDMHEMTKNLSKCYADGIHPTSRGYTYLAYQMHCALTETTPDETYVQSFKDK